MHKSICLISFLTILFSGCTKDHASKPVTTEATIIECTTCMDTFSFAKNIIPIFAANCATPGCHDPDDQSGGLELDSAAAYSSINNNGGVVTPGNASKSFLYTYLVPGGAEEMPQNNFPLDSCDINKIYCWIQQGARNN